VLDDVRAQRLIDAIEHGGKHRVHRIPHLAAFDPEGGGYEVLIRVLEVGLHRRREILKKHLQEEARGLDRYVDALLLGYGQCGGALENPRELIDVHCPVFYPQEGEHPVADCVGLCLGGNSEYHGEQRQAAGTYYLTPGWCRHWRDMFKGAAGVQSLEISPSLTRRMFRGYKRLLLVHSPVQSQQEMRTSAEELASLSGLSIEEREGSLHLLLECYQAVKRVLGIL
jgi:hypothetical protein